jgi:hypothetical protein
MTKKLKRNNMEELKLPSPFELKTENRFIVRYPDKLFKLAEFVTYEVSKISCQFEGDNVLWDSITFKMYDPISPSTSQAIMQALQDKVTVMPLIDEAVDISLQILGPVGDVVSEWKLTGRVTSIDFGSFSWKSKEHVSIDLHFDVHYAMLLY